MDYFQCRDPFDMSDLLVCVSGWLKDVRMDTEKERGGRSVGKWLLVG